MTQANNDEVLIYQLHILLLQITPAVWCRVLVRSHTTVARSTRLSRRCAELGDIHLHRFRLNRKDYDVYPIGGLDFKMTFVKCAYLISTSSQKNVSFTNIIWLPIGSIKFALSKSFPAILSALTRFVLVVNI